MRLMLFFPGATAGHVRRAVRAAGLLLVCAAGLRAQTQMPLPQWELTLSPEGFQKSDTLELTLEVALADKWHVNAHNPSDEFAIPTVLELSGEGLGFDSVQYPEPVVKHVEVFKKEVELYEGAFALKSRVWRTKPDASLSELKGALSYQACSDVICLRPATLEIAYGKTSAGDGEEGVVSGSASGKKTAEGNADEGSLENNATPLTNATSLTDAAPFNNAIPGSGKLPDEKDPFSGSLLWIILLLLGGGLALNLTPCVYPLLAVTISIFGNQGARSPQGRLALSVSYVLGMVLSFAALGLMASLGGKLFGSALQSPAAQILIALIFVVLAVSSFGLFEIRLPSSWMGKATTAGNMGGVAGSFLGGVFAGVLASPCIGPFILALIVYVAERGEAFTGFWMFGTLALGMGLPYLVLGVFTGMLQNLPKSGAWMGDVKKILGLVLLALANYYLRGFMNPEIYQWIFGGLLIVMALYVNPFQNIEGVPRWLSALLRALAFVVLLYGLLAVAKGSGWGPGVVDSGQPGMTNSGPREARGPTGEAKQPGFTWHPYSDALVEEAQSAGQLVLLDFESKVWCAACREMEEKTYSQASVQNALENYMLLKVDVDKHPHKDALIQKYGVVGIPTVFVISPGGEVLRRIVGYVPPEEFINRLPKAGML